jgi:hypothetical protein
MCLRKVLFRILDTLLSVFYISFECSPFLFDGHLKDDAIVFRGSHQPEHFPTEKKLCGTPETATNREEGDIQCLRQILAQTRTNWRNQEVMPLYYRIQIRQNSLERFDVGFLFVNLQLDFQSRNVLDQSVSEFMSSLQTRRRVFIAGLKML